MGTMYIHYPCVTINATSGEPAQCPFGWRELPRSLHSKVVQSDGFVKKFNDDIDTLDEHLAKLANE